MTPLPPSRADDTWRFGHFEIDPAARLLRVRGEPVPLGGRAFDLLLVLAEQHDRVVAKQELLDRVWPGLVVEEHNIATQVGNLRKLLGAGAIATVAGHGYRLTAKPAVPTRGPAGPGTATALALPEPRTRFIGRDAALAGLARLLPATRLLTLTGIGGCGKTRLALQFAQQQVAAFADGACFVDLAPLQDGDRVALACAAALGLRDEGEAPPTQQLLAHLAARRTLLLLDNCEHVLAGVVPLVEALLAGGAGTTVLATSREALGVRGEQVYPVRSLTLPATDDPHAVMAAESVRVFVDRARLGLPEFEVDAANAAAIADICRRLDGIALAIELAAARTTMLSPAEIATRLDDRFRLLVGGSPAVPRQQTLEAMMQWSYEQLAPAEQRMLRQVSVFSGGWTLRAAADVAQTADDYEALAILTSLHDKSLLVADRSAAPADAARYRMLETVRQYALERLELGGGGAAARSRHVRHCVAFAEEAAQHVRGTAQDFWIARFRQEHENVIAAVAFCCAGGVDPQWGLRLIAATGYYWVWNGIELGDRLARAVLASDLGASDTAARVDTLRTIAKLSLFRGRYEESLEYAQQALAAARRLGVPRVLMLAFNEMGSALNTLGRTGEALEHQEEALALARTLGDGEMTAVFLNSFAESRRAAGDLDAAERCYREALDLVHAQGGRHLFVVVLKNLIRVQVAKGCADEARRLAVECLPRVRHERVGVDLLEAMVGLASLLGEPAMAARLWGAADQKLRDWGYRHQPVDIDHTAPRLAQARRALGEAAFDAAEAAGRTLEFDTALLELEAWLAR